MTLRVEIPAQKLDLSTGTVELRKPVKVTAAFSRITNAVTVDMTIDGHLATACSRCLEPIERDFQKKLKLNYPLDRDNPILLLDDDIREEIILEYPLNPLCCAECKGLCPRCGANLNAGPCGCEST
jgi:uncharacterized protein